VNGQQPGSTFGRSIPAVIIAAVWLVFLIRGVHTLLIPPLAALAIIFILYPYRQSSWAFRTMIVAGLIATLWLMAKVQTIVWIAALGLFSAYVLNPVVVRLEGMGIKRSRGALYLILVGMTTVVAMGVVILPDLYSQAGDLVANLPRYLMEIQERYQGTLSDPRYANFPIDLAGLADIASAKMAAMLSGADQGIASLLRNVGAALSIAILTPIVGYHLLKDLPQIKSAALGLVPRNFEGELIDLITEMDVLIGRWLRGQFTVAVIIGTLTAIALTVIGVRYSIALGFMAGLFNMIPIVGYWVSLILAVIIALTGGNPTHDALWTVGAFFAIQLLEQNLISPRIVGRETGLHPVAILLSLLVFGALAGFAGALLAIPFTLFIRVFFRRYIARRLRNARLPSV
jgi:predicted PurR-regulated permease PerM